MPKEKIDINDYADQLQQLCGVSKHCNRCIKRGKNIATNYCIIKRFAFECHKQDINKCKTRK